MVKKTKKKKYKIKSSKKGKQKGGFPIKNFSLLKKHYPTLQFIGDKYGTSKKQRNQFINNLNKGDLNAVRCMLDNFLHERIPVTEDDLKKLKRDKKNMYLLLEKSVSAQKKKNILKQRGGAIFAPLLAGLLPSVLPIVRKVLKI